MSQKQSVFVIEDDPDIRHLLESILSKNGYFVFSADSSETALKRIPSIKPSLILMDFELPGSDGLECCKKVRSIPETKDIPIIFLTVHNSEVYKITALESGADDFITKPFSHGELLARVKAVLKRSKRTEPQEKSTLKDGVFTLNSETRIVHLKDKRLRLAPKEFLLLEFFLRSKGQVLSREVLAAQIWEQDSQQISRTIDVHLARLRKKLGKYKKNIQTVGKLGYRYESPS